MPGAAQDGRDRPRATKDDAMGNFHHPPLDSSLDHLGVVQFGQGFTMWFGSRAVA